MADEFHSISMFQFAFNNPISANDPSGLRTIYTLKGPVQREGLREYIYNRNSNEYSYNEHTGQYKDGNGNLAEWGKVNNFLQENYAVNPALTRILRMSSYVFGILPCILCLLFYPSPKTKPRCWRW